MSACARCGQEFNGTPWDYSAEGRVHVSCTQTTHDWAVGQRGHDEARPDEHADRVPISDTRWSRPFPLIWPAWCHACNGRIVRGTRAHRRKTDGPDGRGVYRHEVCPK